jgi:hypothetical protein
MYWFREIEMLPDNGDDICYYYDGFGKSLEYIFNYINDHGLNFILKS